MSVGGTGVMLGRLTLTGQETFDGGVWPELRRLGWEQREGSSGLMSSKYVMPGRSGARVSDLRNGEDYFESTDEVMTWVREEARRAELKAHLRVLVRAQAALRPSTDACQSGPAFGGANGNLGSSSVSGKASRGGKKDNSYRNSGESSSRIEGTSAGGSVAGREEEVQTVRDFILCRLQRHAVRGSCSTGSAGTLSSSRSGVSSRSATANTTGASASISLGGAATPHSRQREGTGATAQDKSLYCCGQPGTGKTLSVDRAVELALGDVRIGGGTAQQGVAACHPSGPVESAAASARPQ